MISPEVAVKKAFYTLINVTYRMPDLSLVALNGSPFILLWLVDRRIEMNGSGKSFFCAQSLAECSFEDPGFGDSQ